MAVFAIISGAKLSSSIMILSIPIIDMVWVMLYRFIKLKDEPFLKRPFVGGNVHLHHRLMALGLTQVQTLLIEISAVSVSALIAVLLGGFSDFLTYMAIGFTVLIIAFTAISILTHNRKKTVIKKDEPPQPPMQESGPTPEQKYAY
jgi:UDP-GlcNAc:undecaprenyl-phosphate GlcNAc-1-phosphate transferase